jgi:hypothetical protein
LLITLREHLCSPPVFDGVRCCSLLFASTCVHLRFLMGAGVAHFSSRVPVFTSSFWWGPVLLITLREHLCSPPVFDGVRCCSLLFASTFVHFRFLMGSGVAHYSSRAPVFTSGFWWGPVLLITLREHLCSTPVFDGVRCCSLLFASTCVHFQFLMGVRCCSLLFASTKHKWHKKDTGFRIAIWPDVCITTTKEEYVFDSSKHNHRTFGGGCAWRRDIWVTFFPYFVVFTGIQWLNRFL